MIPLISMLLTGVSVLQTPCVTLSLTSTSLRWDPGLQRQRSRPDSVSPPCACRMGPKGTVGLAIEDAIPPLLPGWGDQLDSWCCCFVSVLLLCVEAEWGDIDSDEFTTLDSNARKACRRWILEDLVAIHKESLRGERVGVPETRFMPHVSHHAHGGAQVV